MKLLIQRVLHSAVFIDGKRTASIGPGLLVFFCAEKGDTPSEAKSAAVRAANLRIFSGSDGKFRLSLLDTGGEALVVPQFTLCADCGSGRRPDFTAAAAPAEAVKLLDIFISALKELLPGVSQGVFGASMRVELANDGPVTIWLDPSGGRK